MAIINRIVDISTDVVATRQRRGHAVLRVGVPILGVALVIVAILGITLYSHTANRNGVLALSNHLLDKTDDQIAPHGALDHVGWKAVTGIVRRGHDDRYAARGRSARPRT